MKGEQDRAVIGELAVASGALVEQGGSCTAGVDTLLDALADEAEAAAGFAGDLDRDEERSSFRRLVVGAMARLARSTDARRAFRAHPRASRAVRAIAERSEWHVFYLVELLDMLDDEPLWLVEGDRVSRWRVTGVRNCFELITLLEGHDVFALDDAALRTSRGYYTGEYLQVRSGLVRDIIQTMIPGDMRPTDLPRFDGIPVVVRTATGVHRSWDAAFVSPIHDALHPSVVKEVDLDDVAAGALLARMARP
jgi:hypothetical protein